MTTLDDTLDALLESPGNPALHHAVCDRLEEETPDARKALLDLVIANKGNDGPRLAFALWCESHGEQERAEFIRVQCDIARGVRCQNPRFDEIRSDSYGSGPVDAIYRPCGVCDSCEKHLHRIRRGQELLNRYGYTWLSPALVAIESERHGRSCGYARGFVESIICTATDWLKYADAILAEHPIETVRLATAPTIGPAGTQSEIENCTDAEKMLPTYRIAGQFVKFTEQQVVLWRAGVRVARFEHVLIQNILHERWRGIDVQLPPYDYEYGEYDYEYHE